MKIVTPMYYKDFECIAGDCPDSCCQGWEVDADEKSMSYYHSISGEIKDKIMSVLDKDEFDNIIFKLTDNKRCPFLNNENLCDMHIAIGGEHTPFTCRNFPRFTNDFGGTKEMGISLSCPVACDMIYNLTEKISFETEINGNFPEPNDIDPQLYFELLKGRKESFDIIYDDSKPIANRLCDLLDLGLNLQNDIDEYTQGNDETPFMEVFNNPEVINQQWVDKVKNSHLKEVKNTFSNVNIAVYFIYKYFLTAVFDNDILSKVKMAVVGVLISTYIGDDSWTIHLWSKETEHSQYNMDRYKSMLKDCKCLSVESLKKMLLAKY